MARPFQPILFWFLGLVCGALAWNAVRAEANICAELSDELVLAESGNLGATIAALSALDDRNETDVREILEASLATSAVVLAEWKGTLQTQESAAIVGSLARVRVYLDGHPAFLSKDGEARARLEEILPQSP